MWPRKLQFLQALQGGFLATEIIIRILLLMIFIFLEKQSAFKRDIQPDEMWLYKYPHMESYVSAMFLWISGIVATMGIFLTFYTIHRDVIELIQAHLSASMSMLLTCVITDIIKVIVGRPRPDFFYRCFPDGIMNEAMMCTGEMTKERDGRKSFPSGHASYAFASLGFCTLYLCGKLHIFTDIGRGQMWRLLIAMLPSLLALGIAISRTCDYHHHWQDVTVGIIMGCAIAYLCYRQYYPALCTKYAHLSYAQLRNRSFREQNGLAFLEVDETKNSIKWI